MNKQQHFARRLAPEQKSSRRTAVVWAPRIVGCGGNIETIPSANSWAGATSGASTARVAFRVCVMVCATSRLASPFGVGSPVTLEGAGGVEMEQRHRPGVVRAAEPARPHHGCNVNTLHQV